MARRAKPMSPKAGLKKKRYDMQLNAKHIIM